MIAQLSIKLMLLTLALSLAVPNSADARRKVRHGFLEVESMIEGVKVYVDGKLVGKTPFAIPVRLRPGKHKLKATKFGYSTMELRFKIRKRKQTTLSVDLIPHSGLVKFTSNIAGAEIYVDGKLLGHAPLIKNVSIGDHKIMIVKEGHNDYEASLNVKAGEKHFIDGKLTTYENLSPDVLALRKAQEEEEARKKELAEKIAATPIEPVTQTEPVATWYSDIHTKWWFWTAAGAVLVTAVAVPLAVNSDSPQAGLNSHSSPAKPIRLP